MDLLLDLANMTESNEFSKSKKGVLKFLKIIGVDSRFISYTPEKIYINNLRFSKFSRKREDIFKKQFSDIEVVRNSLFQKICSKSSKVLSDIEPNSVILIPKNNELMEIILEPYTRKYGVKLVYSGGHDLIANPLILDDEVNSIFSSIFKGEGINFGKKEGEIYPFINVSKKWINSFLEMDNKECINGSNGDELANSFMKFLEDVVPQYRENVLKASEFIEEKLKIKQ